MTNLSMRKTRRGNTTQTERKAITQHNSTRKIGYSGGIQTHETSTHILGNTLTTPYQMQKQQVVWGRRRESEVYKGGKGVWGTAQLQIKIKVKHLDQRIKPYHRQTQTYDVHDHVCYGKADRIMVCQKYSDITSLSVAWECIVATWAITPSNTVKTK